MDRLCLNLTLNTSLTSLILYGNQITTKSAVNLASVFREHKSLTNINLRWNNIEDDGAQAFTEVTT